MDISILTKRYSTPMYVKVIGTLLFPAVFIIMLVLPVFELIPLEEYGNVFNIHGVPNGSTYHPVNKTVFTMLPVDYHSEAIMVCFIVVAVLCVICGIAFLWMNRAKLAAIPSAVMLVMAIFSALRSPNPFYDEKHVDEFWDMVNKTIRPVPGTDDATGAIMQYKVDGKDYILHLLGQYWVIWVATIVLLAFVVFAIVKTKTLIEKKK